MVDNAGGDGSANGVGPAESASGGGTPMKSGGMMSAGESVVDDAGGDGAGDGAGPPGGSCGACVCVCRGCVGGGCIW